MERSPDFIKGATWLRQQQRRFKESERWKEDVILFDKLRRKCWRAHGLDPGLAHIMDEADREARDQFDQWRSAYKTAIADLTNAETDAEIATAIGKLFDLAV